MKCALVPARPQYPAVFFPEVRQAVDRSHRPLIRAGYAYATLSGVDNLIGEMSVAAKWSTSSKQFLVSIHHGISEPEAIRSLSAIPRAEVRLFLPHGRMERKALLATPVFHPKVVAVSDGVTSPALVVAGSMNLTSAMGPRTLNYEFGLLAKAEDPEDASDFLPWWDSAWRQGRSPTESMLKQYAGIRGDLLQRNPVLQTLPDPPNTIAQANEFWIEVGRASGIDRHQVEFPEALAAFFGPVTRGRVMLTLMRGGRSWQNRPLSHKITTYGVEIWRLGMPTIRMSAEPIQNRVLMFRRTNQPLTFEYDVADVGSPKARSWRDKSNLSGHLGRTRGEHPREYGFNA